MAKKSSNAFFWILGGVIILLGLFIVISGSAAPDIDYSAYNYTDASLEKQNATHVLEEFSDYQCPYCGQVAPVVKQVMQDFDVRVEYKHFPLTQIHPYAQTAAEAAECARDQGRFWAYSEVLFNNQEMLARSHLDAYAEGLGLDMEAFESCMDTRAKQTVVAEDALEGNRRGVSGTPTFFLDGEQVNARSYADFAALLE